MANRITNAIGGRAGKGKPHLTNTKILKYGFTAEQQIAYRKMGFRWCGWHKKYEEPSGFNRGCKICKTASRLRDIALYKKDGNSRRYHVPKGWYAAKFEEQGCHCALCPETLGSRGHARLSIDHDHNCCVGTSGAKSCGKCVRGILCTDCNHRLGNLEMTMADGDVIPRPDTWTAQAFAYLKKYSPISEESVMLAAKSAD